MWTAIPSSIPHTAPLTCTIFIFIWQIKTEATKRSFSLALNGGGRIFLSPSSPLSSLLCCLVSWETLSALLSKLKYYGLTGLLMQLTRSKLGFRGTWLPWWDVPSRLYEGCLGEVANRVSGGSFRGGYLPIRNHDNRYFADWIRLCPGLSKNSENGNSCPKPHKAARMIEAVGRAVSIETETVITIWIISRRSSRLYKGKLIILETKMDRESSLENWNAVTCPKDKTFLSFSGSPSGLGKAKDITDIAPPPTTRLCSLRSAGPVKRVWPAPDQWLRDQMAACWAGFTSPVAMSCVYGVCAFVLLRCFSCSHTVLPKEHSLGVIFFLLTLLMLMLYFSSILLAFHYWLYSVWLCMWRIIKNLELSSVHSPVARASSRSLSSSAGCWMFQDVRGSVFTSSMSRSRNMSIWLLLVKYLGMKQTLPLLKMSWRMSSVRTSSFMFRKTATRWLDRYLGCLNN